MFLIIVDYKKPLEEVERYLAEHWAFLDRYFAQGKLLCTGPQNPRTGGDRFESRESCGSRSLYAGRSVLPA